MISYEVFNFKTKKKFYFRVQIRIEAERQSKPIPALGFSSSNACASLIERSIDANSCLVDCPTNLVMTVCQFVCARFNLELAPSSGSKK